MWKTVFTCRFWRPSKIINQNLPQEFQNGSKIYQKSKSHSQSDSSNKKKGNNQCLSPSWSTACFFSVRFGFQNRDPPPFQRSISKADTFLTSLFWRFGSIVGKVFGWICEAKMYAKCKSTTSANTFKIMILHRKTNILKKSKNQKR